MKIPPLSLKPSFLLLFGLFCGFTQVVNAQQNPTFASTDSSKIYQYVEQMPEFPGGGGAMFSFIKSNIVYPDSALRNSISGTVFLRIVINEQGSLDDVKVLTTPDSLLAYEAVRVVKSMPQWTPGKQNGRPVKVMMNLPVRFALPEGAEAGKKEKKK